MARTNEELNKAIWTVLTTQFKKNAKEAFQTVQENGYEVCKNCGGTWTVRNPHTKRFVYIQFGDRRTTLYYGNYTTQMKRWRTSQEEAVVAAQFDFVNCLKTPNNSAYYDMLHIQNAESKAAEQYSRIRSAKWSIEYETKRIAKIQADIARLQAELVKATESRVKDEMTLKQVRQELGLAM